MTQQEFETLAGGKVLENSFEIINEMYLINENETKEDFVKRFKKMSHSDLWEEFYKVYSNLKERHAQLKGTIDSLNHKLAETIDNGKKAGERWVNAEQRISELVSQKEKAICDIVEANQKLHDFAAMVAVETHQFDKTATVSACVETLGLVGYYKALLNAGCIPTQDDLKLAIEALEK